MSMKKKTPIVWDTASGIMAGRVGKGLVSANDNSINDRNGCCRSQEPFSGIDTI